MALRFPRPRIRIRSRFSLPRSADPARNPLVSRPGWFDLTGRGEEPWHRELAEWRLGPIRTPDGLEARTLEWAWFGSQVHASDWEPAAGRPTGDWEARRRAALVDRYPISISMRGSGPSLGWWDGTALLDERLARRRIYAPPCADAILASPAWPGACAWFDTADDPVIFDVAGQDSDHRPYLDLALDLSWWFGVTTVLAMLLEHHARWPDFLAEWDAALAQQHP